MVTRITVTIAEHPQAPDFADYLLGEISEAIASTDIEGIPVTYEVVTDYGDTDLLTDAETAEDFSRLSWDQ